MALVTARRRYRHSQLSSPPPPRGQVGGGGEKAVGLHVGTRPSVETVHVTMINFIPEIWTRTNVPLPGVPWS